MDDDHYAILITLAVILAAMLLSPWSGLIDNGYVVTPATEEDIRNAEPVETVQVSFWELPPRVMLISVALSLCPLIACPIEFFFFLKLFSYLGYRKIASASVLDSATRRQIYDTIVQNPGIFFNEILRITGQKRSTLQYHLAVLKFTDKITAFSTRGDVRYFENSGRYSVTEQKVLRSLRNVREREIFECIMDYPAITRSDLMKHLKVSGPTVSWHTGRLSDDGLLAVTRDGKQMRYALPPEVQQFLEKYLLSRNTGPGQKPGPG
nr:winged helix-turn-helix transcriptional regulator [uncultured Methanoregula sp.]